MRTLRFNRVTTLGLIILTWAAWAALLSLPGLMIGPGIITLFLVLIFAVVGMGLQIFATFWRRDLGTLKLSVLATVLSAAGSAAVFQGDNTLVAVLVLILLFIAPVAAAMALVRWLSLAAQPELSAPGIVSPS